MCFSVNVNLVKEEFEIRYGINFPGKYRYEPSYYYHAFGLPHLPAICSEYPETFSLLQWGLIPSWVKSKADADEIRMKTFNARAESIDKKPSWSASFRTKRCLIPVKGFFEWQHMGKEKIPWYIYVNNNEIFSLAGLYSEWKQNDTDEVYNTFSIITTDANPLMAEIHNSKKRMPVILGTDDEKKWIDLSLTSEEALNMLQPFPENMMKAHTISPLVNSRTANRNVPQVILPYTYHKDNTLF
jgi:putative SOS response-associated peptidase YedK